MIKEENIIFYVISLYCKYFLSYMRNMRNEHYAYGYIFFCTDTSILLVEK